MISLGLVRIEVVNSSSVSTRAFDDVYPVSINCSLMSSNLSLKVFQHEDVQVLDFIGCIGHYRLLLGWQFIEHGPENADVLCSFDELREIHGFDYVCVDAECIALFQVRFFA